MNWTSRHSTPASCSASRAATNPYSTKFRPHFPHGCMPTPRTATSCSPIGPRSLDRLPLPDDVLRVVVLEQRAQPPPDRVADSYRRRVDASGPLPEDAPLL